MAGVLKWLYLVSLAVWVGEVVFFSFIVAPSVFRVVPPDLAGRVVGAIFPQYYLVGTIAGIACLLAGGVLWAQGGGAAWGAGATAVGLMLAANLYAGQVIQPHAAALRDAIHGRSADAGESPLKPEFDRLHRRAVQLNALVLILGLVAWGAAAASARP